MASDPLKSLFPWLFRGLSKSDAEALREALTEQRLEADEILIPPGRKTQHLHLLCEGRLAVQAGAKGEILLGHKEPGDFVGEMALIDPAPPSAVVVAETPCVVRTLSRADYIRCRTAHPQVAGNLLSAICCDLARRIRASSVATVTSDGKGHKTIHPGAKALHGVDRHDVRVSWSPLKTGKATTMSADGLMKTLQSIGAFDPAGKEEPTYADALRRDVEALAASMTVHVYFDGETICEPNTLGDGLYVVLEGKARVRAEAAGPGIHIDKLLAPGESFGLIPFFDDGRRTSLVTASGVTVVAYAYAATVRTLLQAAEGGQPIGVHLMDWFARQLVRDARSLNRTLATADAGAF